MNWERDLGKFSSEFFNIAAKGYLSLHRGTPAAPVSSSRQQQASTRNRPPDFYQDVDCQCLEQ